MKCKVFMGKWYEAVEGFNKWAEGKPLEKDVIIHEHFLPATIDTLDDQLAIIVYHPDNRFWDKTPQKLEQPEEEDAFDEQENPAN